MPVIIGAAGIVTKDTEKFGSHARKTFNRFSSTYGSYTWNITNNTGSTAV
jgi:hypothetical protein